VVNILAWSNNKHK